MSAQSGDAKGPPLTDYPEEYRRRGIEGEVYIEFTVLPDGHPRLPRILYAVPGPGFNAEVIDNVMHTTYLPARINGIPVPTSSRMFVHFQIRGAQIGEYGDLKNRVAATKAALRCIAVDVITCYNSGLCNFKFVVLETL